MTTSTATAMTHELGAPRERRAVRRSRGMRQGERERGEPAHAAPGRGRRASRPVRGARSGSSVRRTTTTPPAPSTPRAPRRRRRTRSPPSRSIRARSAPGAVDDLAQLEADQPERHSGDEQLDDVPERRAGQPVLRRRRRQHCRRSCSAATTTATTPETHRARRRPGRRRTAARASGALRAATSVRRSVIQRATQATTRPISTGHHDAETKPQCQPDGPRSVALHRGRAPPSGRSPARWRR